MAVLTWRNVNAPTGAALGALNAGNDRVDRGFDALNQTLDKFQQGRSDMAESAVTRRLLEQQDYDQFQQAQASGQLMEGVNSAHLTPDALGRINAYGDNLLQRSTREEALNQSRTLFGNQQDDRASEQAIAPIAAQLFQAASRGDSNTVNSIMGEYGEQLGSIPLDRLESIMTGSMGLEQGRSGINNQLHSQRMAEANYGLNARKVANAERAASNTQQTAAQKAMNDQLSAGYINMLGRSAGGSPEQFERLYENEVGTNPDIPITVKQEIWEEGIKLFPGSYGVGSSGNSSRGSGSSENTASPIIDPDLMGADATLSDLNFDRATRGAPSYFRPMMENLNNTGSVAEVTQELRSSVASDIPEVDISSAIERVIQETNLPPSAAGAIVNDAIRTDRNPLRNAIEMGLYGPNASPRNYGINREILDASIAEITSNKTQDNLFVDQMGQNYNQSVSSERQKLENLLRTEQELSRRARNNPMLRNTLSNVQSEVSETRERLNELLGEETRSRSLLQ